MLTSITSSRGSHVQSQPSATYDLRPPWPPLAAHLGSIPTIRDRRLARAQRTHHFTYAFDRVKQETHRPIMSVRQHGACRRTIPHSRHQDAQLGLATSCFPSLYPAHPSSARTGARDSRATSPWPRSGKCNDLPIAAGFPRLLHGTRRRGNSWKTSVSSGGPCCWWSVYVLPCNMMRRGPLLSPLTWFRAWLPLNKIEFSWYL
jgi:hypothetical protein